MSAPKVFETFTTTGIRSVDAETSEFLFTEPPNPEMQEWAKATADKAAKQAEIDLATQQPPTDKPSDFVTRALKVLPEATRPSHSSEIWASATEKGQSIAEGLNLLISSETSEAVEMLFDTLNWRTIANGLKAGWNRIEMFGDVTPVAELPDFRACVFDTETFVQDPNFPNDPIFGQLLTDAGELFLWVHPDFAAGAECFGSRQLVDLGRDHTVVAHNAGFDLGRCVEGTVLEYRNQWIDSVSLAVSTDGSNVSNYSTGYMPPPSVGLRIGGRSFDLASVYQFYVDPDFKVSKEQRNIFVDATELSDIRKDLRPTLKYSLLDVLYLYRVLRELWPAYTEGTPDPIAYVGLSHVTQQAVFVGGEYEEWLDAARETQANANWARQEIWLSVLRFAAKTGSNCHTQHLDWSPYIHKRGRGKKARERQTSLPVWYAEQLRAQHKKRKKGEAWKPPMKVGNACLMLHWVGEPLVFIDSIRKKKVAPKETKFATNAFIRAESVEVPTPPDADGSSPYPDSLLSHKREEQLARNGGPLWAVQNKALETLIDLECLTQMVSKCAGRQWDGVRRFEYGDATLCIAGGRPNGTVSRRVTSSLPLTVKKQAGATQPFSEMKARWQTPSTHLYLYSDFSSQESVIMALLAEKNVNSVMEHGYAGVSATALINFVGDKAHGTDTHTKFASSMGLTRKEGKGFSLGVQFGLGKPGLAKRLLETFPDRFPTSDSAMKAATAAIEGRAGVEKDGVFSGGTESDAHNAIAEMCRDNPHEMFLRLRSARSRCSRWKSNRLKHNQRSIKNFPCQAGGVAILSMCCAVYDDLIQRAGLTSEDARIMFSVHDELVACARREHAVVATVLLNLTHAIVWARCFEIAGVRELPVTRSLFDDISLDVRWRVEATSSEVSPSTPDGFPHGLLLSSEDQLAALNDPNFKLPEPHRSDFQVSSLEWEMGEPKLGEKTALQAFRDGTYDPEPPTEIDISSHSVSGSSRKHIEMEDRIKAMRKQRLVVGGSHRE